MSGFCPRSHLRGFLNTYTPRPHPTPAHSDWMPTHVSRVVLVDCKVVVVVRLVLFISTSHQGSSSIDHCVGTGFDPFKSPDLCLTTIEAGPLPPKESGRL